MDKILNCDGVAIYLHCMDIGKHNGFARRTAPNVYDIVINSNIPDTIRSAMIDQQCQYILQHRPTTLIEL